MPNKELLEDYQLYRKKQIRLPRNRGNWPQPAVVAHCDECKSVQTFNMLNAYDQYDEADVLTRVAASQWRSPSHVVRLVYGCASCNKGRRFYLVMVLQAPPRATGGVAPPETSTDAKVMKVGQYPPFDITPDRGVAAKLGEQEEVFKKGLICESQGYGIGAYSYYRRIVETIIDRLLDDIAESVPQEDYDEFAAAVERAKKSKAAADKIEIVKDLLPANLRPGGANPLTLLHSALSKGLHSLSDEDCLERAVSIRKVLVFLVHQINEAQEAAQVFSTHIKKLLDEKSK